MSTFSATCVSINMMIGAGMLALPYGFAKGGIFASLAILILICLWMIITCLWEGRSVIQCGRILKAGSKVPEGLSPPSLPPYSDLVQSLRHFMFSVAVAGVTRTLRC